jgi:hypothetical protein
MKMFVVVVAGLALAGAADAQMAVRPAPRVAVASAAVRQVDPVAVLQSRVTRLEHRVNALESTLSKTQPALSFQCTDVRTSQNSVGVAEDCTPYACAPIDGRCRVTAKTSADCAPGYLWVDGGGCVAAP